MLTPPILSSGRTVGIGFELDALLKAIEEEGLFAARYAFEAVRAESLLQLEVSKGLDMLEDWLKLKVDE